MGRIHSLLGCTVEVHALGLAFDRVGKPLTTGILKDLPRVFACLQPELFSSSQVGKYCQRQSIRADTIPSEHPARNAMARRGQQLAAVLSKLIDRGSHEEV